MIISHTDPRLSWQGQVSLERTESYTRPWRIPFDQKSLFSPALLGRAAMAAGVRVTFRSSSRTIKGRFQPLEGTHQVDLCLDGKYFASEELKEGEPFGFAGLPSGEKSFELWLPQGGNFALEELEVDEGSALQALSDPRPRWITYGSSITHCGGAASPTRTWPAIVARKRNLHLTCLGFGGQCHLDVQVARTIRDLPADYLSICAGINIYGQGSLNERTFGPALIGFVQILREKHPKTPILLISPIYGFQRETTPNNVGWTLNDYRQAVAEAAGILREAGDDHVQSFDGRRLLDADAETLMPDRLHPNAEGYEVLGQNFLERAAPEFFQ